MESVHIAMRRIPAVQIPDGGLLVVGGPPLEGKGLMAARLAEWLPFGLKIESVDSLSHDDEVWFPNGPAGKTVAAPWREMLALARQIWERREPAEPPVIVLSARFGTAVERSRAARMAKAARMKFLFVEARSSQIRALRRIPLSALTAERVVSRVERYEAILRRYEPVTAGELDPSRVRVRNTLGNLEGALQRVLRGMTIASGRRDPWNDGDFPAARPGRARKSHLTGAANRRTRQLYSGGGRVRR